MRTATFRRTVCCLACLIGFSSFDAGAQVPSPAKRVLLLHHVRSPGPFRGKFDVAFVEAIRSFRSASIDLYEESIETRRFSDADQSRVFRDYLKAKYANRKIDVIVAQGTTPLAFARENRSLFGEPAILTIVSPSGLLRGADDNVTGLQGGFWITGTIDLALRLFPQTQSVVVVDGARDSNVELRAEIERQIREHNPPLQLTYLSNLPLADVAARIATIDQRSVVLFAKQTMRTRSQDVDQLDALAEVLRASRAPVFSQLEDLIGHGVVGGSVWRFEADAKRMAEMARLIATGTKPSDIAPGRGTYETVVDWRELQRWRIPEAQLPAGTVVLFRPTRFFELYRSYVLAGIIAFAAQLALIAGLFIQSRRRQRAERQTRSSEQRYRSVVDTQSELICRFLPDSTLTFVNDAYCRFWNKSREQLLGTRFSALIPPSARHGVLERIGRISQGIDSHEHEVVLPDGTIGWHHWINHAIVDERGKLIELQGVGRDITDRKHAEEALGQAEARNSAMLRAIPDLMFVLQRDGTYVDYHARDPKLLFVPPSTFIGKNVRDVLPPEIAPMLLEAIERACHSDETVVVEYDLQMSETRHFEARLVRAGADRVLSIVRDVTQAKRATELSRDLAGRLIASQEAERQRIARELHDDLSQKIALLNMEIDKVTQQVPAGAPRARLLQISGQVGEIATEVHNLSYELHPSKLQTLGLVAAVQSLCRDTSRQSGVPVVFTHGDLPQRVDPNVSLCLYRIAQEALHNVARHSRASEAQVHLGHDDDNTVTLQIADSGVGFDPRNGRHAGLGLISMRERVAFLHGQLAIQSSPGSGTRIGVRVPVSPPVRGSSPPVQASV